MKNSNRKKDSSSRDYSSNQAKDLLQQVEQQYLRNLQESMVNKNQSFDKLGASQNNEHYILDSEESSRNKENSENLDADLMQTIQSLEKFQIERDECYSNGEEDRFAQESCKVGVQKTPEVKQEKIEQTEETPEISHPTKKDDSKTATPTYEPGTILKLENDTIGVFKESLADKEYDIIYYLKKDGKIEPQGVSLFSYSSERIGKLPKEVLPQIENKMQWERDLIIFHLDNFEASKLIPQIAAETDTATSKVAGSTPPRTQAVTPPTRKKPSLERGRKIKLKMGNHIWEAVFWCSDNDSAIVAHKTSKQWEMARISLNRYKDSIEIGDYLTSSEIKEIENSLVQDS